MCPLCYYMLVEQRGLNQACSPFSDLVFPVLTPTLYPWLWMWWLEMWRWTFQVFGAFKSSLASKDCVWSPQTISISTSVAMYWAANPFNDFVIRCWKGSRQATQRGFFLSFFFAGSSCYFSLFLRKQLWWRVSHNDKPLAHDNVTALHVLLT